MEYHIAKGVFDILPIDPDNEGKWRESHLWQYIENLIRKLADQYGFREIRTPLFEHTELFTRSIGKGTDIVSKEMYSFEDKGGRHLSLRPEGTAPVMRAFVEKNLNQLAPKHKFFYIYPMFRYERGQAGRYRQHHQFGIEAIGEGSFLQDVEVIQLLYAFLESLGLKKLTLHLNSIGNKQTRESFKEALKHYLLPHFEQLSKESQERLAINPLRILDSKNPQDKKVLKEAPSILDFLDEESKVHFESVCHFLNKASVPFVINPFLVRGLDYYNRTVFEVTADELGAQNSLGGGGRYDGLIKELGGPDLPSCGFGCGIERILQTAIAQGVYLPEAHATSLFLIPLGDQALAKCFELLSDLRRKGLSVEMDFSGKKLKNAMRYADSIKVRFVAIIGENELEKGHVELKEMKTGTTETVPFDQLEKKVMDGKLY